MYDSYDARSDLPKWHTEALHDPAQSFTANGFTYTPDLRVTGEIKQSILQSIDRVTATIQNIDQDISSVIKDESIIKAKAVVGRYYVEVNGTVTSHWVYFLEARCDRPAGLISCSIEILNDLAAAGYCVGHWTLAPNCQFQYSGDVRFCRSCDHLQ